MSYAAVKKCQDRKRRFVDSVKETAACTHCGESDPVVLDLHHVNRKEKNMPTYGERARRQRHWRQLSWPHLVAELEKCIVLCANCHRREERG